ncbi:ABC transporter-like protein [Salinisphaera dokdonensis CL-ES53]|uniref:ABC transporter-like protein n=1 Tax=Salinisphaera dokdonensis CL-ES53 TaxID=1304272 RepID=A0ABV2B2Z1_9GAMM
MLLMFVLLALLVIPMAIGDAFVYHIFITICMFAGLATAWNIVGGYAGQLSLGHAVFYGIGAYVGMLLVSAGITPWIGMFAGAGIAALVAVAISYPCFRLHGPFFALASIAFLEVFRVLALHFGDITGGATGMMVPLETGWQWMIFRDRLPSLVIAFGLMLTTLAVAWGLRRHRFGFYLVATRERESAARSAGIGTVRMRLLAVAVSAALTAMIGTFHAMYLTFIEPSSVFSLTFSIQIAMFALIGGIGTIFGPLVGTILLVPLTELARGWLGAEALGLHGFVYGTVLVLAVLFMPDGIMSALGKLVRKRATAPGASEGAPRTAESVERPAIGGAVLKAENLDKHFGGLHVTNNVSFTLREGEVLGVIGPNGAGKTTVFNMLSGFLKPDSGRVLLRDADGEFRSPTSPGDFARLQLGRTFQIVQPFAAMTVEENIMVGAFHRHPRVADARRAAREMAERMGLSRHLDDEARGLPVGALKRLEIARVMAMEPRVLLLDEAMAGINRADLRQAIELIREIRDTGVSIIAIEHVMQAIMSLSDRVIVINSGEVIAEGEPDAVVRDEAVIEAYLGKESVDAEAA